MEGQVAGSSLYGSTVGDHTLKISQKVYWLSRRFSAFKLRLRDAQEM